MSKNMIFLFGMSVCIEAMLSTSSWKWLLLAAVTKTKSSILSGEREWNDSLGGMNVLRSSSVALNGMLPVEYCNDSFSSEVISLGGNGVLRSSPPVLNEMPFAECCRCSFVDAKCLRVVGNLYNGQINNHSMYWEYLHLKSSWILGYVKATI